MQQADVSLDSGDESMGAAYAPLLNTLMGADGNFIPELIQQVQ